MQAARPGQDGIWPFYPVDVDLNDAIHDIGMYLILLSSFGSSVIGRNSSASSAQSPLLFEKFEAKENLSTEIFVK